MLTDEPPPTDKTSGCRCLATGLIQTSSKIVSLQINVNYAKSRGMLGRTPYGQDLCLSCLWYTSHYRVYNPRLD